MSAPTVRGRWLGCWYLYRVFATGIKRGEGDRFCLLPPSHGHSSTKLSGQLVEILKMARPLRIEFPGAIYHVTSRSDRREPIVLGDDDRGDLPIVLGQALHRFDARAPACRAPVGLVGPTHGGVRSCLLPPLDKMVWQ